MNSLILVLALALPGAETETELPTYDIQRDCQKWDGDQPTRCEMALAQTAYQIRDGLQACDLVVRHQEALITELTGVALTPPPPPESKDPLSLFGMPGWVTPVAVIVLVGAGVAAGGLAF